MYQITIKQIYWILVLFKILKNIMINKIITLINYNKLEFLKTIRNFLIFMIKIILDKILKTFKNNYLKLIKKLKKIKRMN